MNNSEIKDRGREREREDGTWFPYYSPIGFLVNCCFFSQFENYIRFRKIHKKR